MAESTKTNRRQNNIIGNRRTVTWDTVTFANNGDTVTLPGLKRVESIDFTPTTATSVGFTVSSPGTFPAIATIVYAGGALSGSFQASGI